jgi:hypothetical protein
MYKTEEQKNFSHFFFRNQIQKTKHTQISCGGWIFLSSYIRNYLATLTYNTPNQQDFFSYFIVGVVAVSPHFHFFYITISTFFAFFPFLFSFIHIKSFFRFRIKNGPFPNFGVFFFRRGNVSMLMYLFRFVRILIDVFASQESIILCFGKFFGI